ncbi:gluconokinase [Beijerinckia mobilis]|uniref:gluconokinase n=1 Tax=Beijerinckia mobilis TaxID=231434 RepID=UPI000A04C9AA|nr:gluconokinase [Beijerinckia mobilis]
MGKPIPALVVMGVSGCGKSSLGAAVAVLAGAHLIEGDSFHPPANIAKMRAGIPLSDSDRAGWLARLGVETARIVASGMPVVLTCSALKHLYRETLRSAVPGLGFVFLKLSREEAFRRVATRPGHFMPASLIDSQFTTLEPPEAEPATLTVDATRSITEVAHQVLIWWSTHGLKPQACMREREQTQICAANSPDRMI